MFRLLVCLLIVLFMGGAPGASVFPGFPSLPGFPISPPVETETEAATGIGDIRETDEYQELIDTGFPASYAEPLALLRRAHPGWSFVPLPVTELCSDYTWDYVLDAELEVPERNLIPNQSVYGCCFREDDEKLYDSGYRAVSRKALAHYMDPRNFMNETDIFQFFDVSFAAPDGTAAAVLAGTFMDGSVPDGNETYAQLFTQAGNSFGISSAYLAVKALLEQGRYQPSPTGSGTCGSALTVLTGTDCRALDGYYNLFNIGASGDGKQTILQNAAERAVTGTDGDSWNTLEKSVLGGAAVLSDRFVTNYENTPYLLKFNVDVRSLSKTGQSRNFWGQYAQNVLSAVSEGRLLARTFEQSGCTDGNYRFLIPVYSQMPDAPCPHPSTQAGVQ